MQHSLEDTGRGGLQQPSGSLAAGLPGSFQLKRCACVYAWQASMLLATAAERTRCCNFSGRPLQAFAQTSP